MNTTEFKKQVNALGYKIHIGVLDRLLYISNGGRYLAVISSIEQYRFDLAFETKKEMDDLYSLIGKYIRTPINDRDEPKKFHLKHKHLNLENNQNFLSLDAYGYYLSGDTGKKDGDVQTEFTQVEIDSLPFKVDSDTWDQDDVNKKDDVIVSKYYQDAKPNVKSKRKGYV